MQAQIDPHARPALSRAARTWAASMWEGSSIGISTVSNPHFLNLGKSEALSVVNGEVNRKELMPNLMVELKKGELEGAHESMREIAVPHYCLIAIVGASLSKSRSLGFCAGAL